MSNISITMTITLGEWTSDCKGGYDLWWKFSPPMPPNVQGCQPEHRRRAADVWVDNDGKWNCTVYDPFLKRVVYAQYAFVTAQDAQAAALTFITSYVDTQCVTS